MIDLTNPTDGRARDPFGRVWVTTARGAAEIGIAEAAIRDWTRRKLIEGQLVDGRRWYRLDQLQTLEAAAYRRAQARAAAAVVDDGGKAAAQSDHHHADLRIDAAQNRVNCVIDTIDQGPCNQPAAENGRWNICYSHIGEIFYAYRKLGPDRTESLALERATVRPLQERTQAVEHVYYVRFADRVKIGFSTSLPTRIANLPVDEVLAVEPGGRQLEQMRHAQFAVARIYTNREWFVLTDELRSHCAMLVRHYGMPERYLAAA